MEAGYTDDYIDPHLWLHPFIGSFSVLFWYPTTVFGSQEPRNASYQIQLPTYCIQLLFISEKNAASKQLQLPVHRMEWP